MRLLALVAAVALAGMASAAEPLSVRLVQTAGGPQITVNGQRRAPRFFYGSPTCLCNISAPEKTKLVVPFLATEDTTRGQVALTGYFGTDPIWYSDATLVDMTAGTTNVILAADQEVRTDRYVTPDLALTKGHRYRFVFTHRATRFRTYFHVDVTSADAAGVRHRLPYYYGDTLAEGVRAAAAAGVDFVTFSTDSSWGCEDWWTPPEAPEDYSKLDRLCKHLIAINPRILLVPRVMADAPVWMLKRHPEIRMIYDTGFNLGMSSVSSRLYRREACAAIERLSRHLRKAFPQNYAGLQISGQNSAEWFYMMSQTANLSGYDTPTRDAFRAWLKARGAADWATAEVPTSEARHKRVKDERLVEFARFRQREIASLLVDLGAAAKRGSDGEALTLFFYGYSWELGGVIAGAGETGHFGFEWLMANAKGKIDIFSSPVSYSMRNLTGSTGMMSAAESVLRQGYLWCNEIDHRTHREEMWDHGNCFHPFTDPAITRELVMRDSAAGILRGYGDWWMDLFGRGWYGDADTWRVRTALNRLDEAMRDRKQPYSPRIASVVSEESFLRCGWQSGMGAKLDRRGFATCGLDYGQYLLSDVLANPPKSVKVFYLTVAHDLSETDRARLAALKAARPDAIFVDDPKPADLTAKAIAAVARKAGLVPYTKPGVANVCSAEGFLAVQALADGPLEINVGAACPVFDFLSGERIGIGPCVTLRCTRGENRILRLAAPLTSAAQDAGYCPKPLHESLRAFHAPVVRPVEHVRGFLWLEAESFADYGNWRLDTQFTHKMGSAYLIAPGVRRPIGEARTTLSVPRRGRWHVWARTKDWLPEFSPGRFCVTVGGRRGATLGASRRTGWTWEKAGAFDLAAGEADIRLTDLSGAFARCDALLFTEDAAFVPPAEADATEAARLRFTGCPTLLADKGTFDVVVVGSGVGGMGAALAAARTGARTALVHDRPVLGGNSSIELGIGTDGASISHPNARETGLCEEANLTVGRTTHPRSLSAAYDALVARETNLTVFANQRVMSAEKTGSRIAAVCARDTLTGARSRYRAHLFIDATGDGWVGVFADAARMYGREAASEYGETPAPEKRDALTMSGCLMDRSLCYSYEMRDKPVAYETPDWANVLPDGFDRKVRHIGPEWWLEHGGRFDDLADPERARDELIRIAFAYWGWVKNASHLKEQAKCAEMTFVPYMNGRREGYRLEGDYVLTATDCLAGRVFPDRISYGGWPLDTHDPLGIDNPKGNGYWVRHPGVPIYTIPFRCLYSKNVPNLLFAGRCASVTHIALGSVRVEATLFALGQAAGTAAALARTHGMMPREYGQAHIGELQQRLLKDDMYIPELKNEDPLDLARTARVTATSGQDGPLVAFGKDDPNMLGRHGEAHALTHDRAAFFLNSRDRIDTVECHLTSERDAPTAITARLVAVDSETMTPERGRLVATLDATVPPRRSGFVTFVPRGDVRLGGRVSRLWFVLPKTAGVSWSLRERPLDGGARAWSAGRDKWVLSSGQYAVMTTPTIAVRQNAAAACVTDGVTRPLGTAYHGWMSEPGEALPQAIRLDFPKAVRASEVRLTFDTDLMPKRAPRYSPRLVKAYVVEGLVDGTWRPLAQETDNFLRHRVHRFAETSLTALRVTVTATWGDPFARIFEVRVY